MEEYKVHWGDKSWDGRTFTFGTSPREAAKKFLASAPEIRDELVSVTARGFMRGTVVYHPKDLGETVVESKSSEEASLNPSEQSADLPNEIGSKLDVLIEAQIEANKNLNLIKRFAVIGTITLFAILSWTAKGHTGSWWGWFGFLF